MSSSSNEPQEDTDRETPPSNGSPSQRTASSGEKSPGSSERPSSVKQAVELITKMNITVPLPIMPPNKPPGSLGHKCVVQTNGFGMVIQKSTDVWVYDVKISGVKTNATTIEFSKKSRDDSIMNERKAKCAHIIERLIEQEPLIFKNKYGTYFDGQGLLFTTYELLSSFEKLKHFNIASNELSGELMSLASVAVEIRTADRKKFTLSPETLVSNTANSNLSTNDRLLLQFMDIVMNQVGIMSPERHKIFENGKSFMTHPLSEGFQQDDLREVGDGKVLIVGTQKSIKQIEGPRARGTNNSAVFIDAKKVAVHQESDVATKVSKILKKEELDKLGDGELEKVNGIIRGLWAETTHLKNNRKVQILKLSKQTALSITFEYDGHICTVADYYQKRYDIEVKFKEGPLVTCRENGKNNYYPMEVIKVLPYQRVKMSQVTSEQSQATTKECAVSPLTRQFYIMKGAAALDFLNPNNQYLENAGLKIYGTPFKASCRVLPSPTICYSGNTQSVQNGRWRAMKEKYIVGARCKVWGLYLIPERVNSRKYTVNDLRNFAAVIGTECLNKGMDIPPPADVEILQEYDLEGRLQLAAEHKCQYALILADDTLNSIHRNMKYWERKYSIVTQHLRMSNVLRIMKDKSRSAMLIENIVNKINCKLGGINYGLDASAMNGIAMEWFTDKRMYIGIGLSGPPRAAEFNDDDTSAYPTIVGYSANMKKSRFEFIGDFMLQESRKLDTISCIGEIVKECITRHTANHDVSCEEVVIYRSNIGEGSYSNIITVEIPLVKAILKTIGKENIKILFILVSKEHPVRLMKETIDPMDKLADQNIPPGIVADTVITHPSFKEFYLNSHVAIQGTAKTPRYTVIHDDLNAGMDQLEGMTFALAHNHQIVNLTTSLPCPLYIANEYAKRGAALYAEYSGREESNSETSSGYDDAMRKICFHSSNLGDCRINA